MMRAKKKQTQKRPRLSRRVAADRLLHAVGRWVDACGGSALVAGNIGITDWPGDPEFCFRVLIKVTGRKPVALDTEKTS
jgi:hypothetical protein